MKGCGCRITEQRRLIIDIIVGSDCRCCKEIYYEAQKSDPTIGIATVYRTVSTLQDLGIMKRDLSRPTLTSCVSTGAHVSLSPSGERGLKKEDDEELYLRVRDFLRERGYISNEDFRMTVLVNPD